MKMLLLLSLLLLVTGCATGGGPPPAATQIPYSPTLLTVDRAAAANTYRADVATRQGVDAYIQRLATKAGCTPDWWAGVNKAWSDQQDRQWTLLWTFQPLPNAPASNPTMDIISALVGIGAKVAPLFMLKETGGPC